MTKVNNPVDYKTAVALSDKAVLVTGDIVLVEKRHKKSVKGVANSAKEYIQKLKKEHDYTTEELVSKRSEFIRDRVLTQYFYIGTYNGQERFARDIKEAKRLAKRDGKLTKVINGFPVDYLGGQILTRYIEPNELKRNGITKVKSNYANIEYNI